jgi:hypothetical protein
VLVGQVASAEFVELSLPRTASDAPGRPGDAQRLVVNVVPARVVLAGEVLRGCGVKGG